MDPFAKRIRKQQERSSLHARQMNKNAMSLLHGQLHVLERRQQRNSRALTRTRQAILQELTNAEKSEHERDNEAKVKVAPAASSRSVDRHSLLAPSKRPSTQLKLDLNPNQHSTQPKDYVDNSDALISFPGHHVHHDNPHATKDNSWQGCRFRALSPLNPCPYFPCRRPLSYNHLRLSAISDVGPARMDSEWSQTNTSPVTGLRSHNTNTESSDSHGKDGKPGGSSSARSGGSGMRLKDGHVSPRTSINDRLRGLRELVQELRVKHEEKRPRDWAVNYGDPVSRRLLRKPVVPVSDE